MKSRKQDIMSKIQSLPLPSIPTPQWAGNNSPDSVFSTFKNAIEWAMKEHAEKVAAVILNDLYTTEEFEDDLGLNKPR